MNIEDSKFKKNPCQFKANICVTDTLFPKKGNNTAKDTVKDPSVAKPAFSDKQAADLEAKKTVITGRDDEGNVSSAIVPTRAPTPSNVRWESLHDQHVLVRIPPLSGNPFVRRKVAAFDLDGTLFKWSNESPGFWPNRLEHYELWNKGVIRKLQSLYDDEGYLLVLFTNQGGIQKAHSGKRATLVKSIVDWLASLLDRPLCAIASTRSTKKSPDSSFHKPSPHMWHKVLTSRIFGQGSGLDRTVPEYDLAASFFVGDSADEDDSQGGVDRKFAANVGISFFTPEDYFGPSNKELRSKLQQLDCTDRTIPKEAVEARKSLLGGYLSGPILLILAGVQGSGKSSFCQQITGDNENDNGRPIQDTCTPKWIWLSQDTINNGKSGKREKVESEARKAIQQGNSVIIDRMHLDPEQRKYFVDLANECNIPSHVVLLNPPKEVIIERVKNRINHPGKVEGENGAKLAVASMSRLVLPSYSEGITLISIASSEFAAARLAMLYRKVASPDVTDALCTAIPLSSSLAIPVMTLGTMGIGRGTCTETISSLFQLGFESVDTAPTYKNEDKIGEALRTSKKNVFIIAKVPKRATTSEDVKEEVNTTLEKFQRKSFDLLLLHWPSDAMAGDTLREVWQAMEQCVKDGQCKALGVCNFNQGALTHLLRICTIPPVVNQVERHPLLGQFDLIEFCSRHNILVQAHTPLGQGSEKLLGNDIIQKMANEVSLSPAQVVILWNLQQGILVVPKSTREAHAKELLSLLSPGQKRLSPEQMKALDGLDKGMRIVAPPFMYGNGVYCWGEQMPSNK
ncbi:oxidoreductase, aldo/keto reductase [Nitzschia inconspicua]|uniref:Oxidoreductase, aldo/keto reductase n=1 Tax=Nitzschia inconspicua TaxID=303405 RepID=A0A9K3PCY3_9STRA|nr:oxidoreductase, aldo/keto reductase [Nitzschia inconspicua]